MKALLAKVSAIRVGKTRDYCYLTVAAPLDQTAGIKEIFRDQRVLVTIADERVARTCDGVKTGNWRRDIPVLTDAVFTDKGRP